MLDRAIPFFNIIMRCDQYEESGIFIPEEYSFQKYQEGYENAWAQMEYEIGDFVSFDEAKQYFIKNYLSDKDELVKRGVFLTDKNDNVIGSCLAWKDLKGEEKVASLHWLVVSPRYQSKGLGRAICQKTMEIFKEKEELPVYIHTQPWSWKAILLYISLGFGIQRKDSFSNYENQYENAITTLKKVVSEEQYQLILNNTKE